MFHSLGEGVLMNPPPTFFVLINDGIMIISLRVSQLEIPNKIRVKEKYLKSIIQKISILIKITKSQVFKQITINFYSKINFIFNATGQFSFLQVSCNHKQSTLQNFVYLKKKETKYTFLVFFISLSYCDNYNAYLKMNILLFHG